MSCFDGVIEELKNVSIDYFENKNLYSTTYFLSHCHTDHMEGLRSYAFMKRLKEEPEVFIYCSEITAHILKCENHFIDVSHKIKELYIGLGNIITISGKDGEENQEITVTLIPTGHCPGAVMFLFEGDVNVGRILYTGDFRITFGDAPKFKQLHYSNGMVKEIDKLYLDTTFLSQKYEKFPSRMDSMAIICDLVASWLAQGQDHHAIINLSAKYGSEAVFMTLARQFGMRIHVRDEAYSIFKNVSEIREAVTNDPMITRIHACLGPRRPGQKNGQLSLLPCRVDWFKLLIIKPCALSFTSDVYNGDLESAVLQSENNFVRVCYSCHSSQKELEYFIQYLKPKKIEACVVPPKMSITQTLNKMRKLCLPIYGEENMPVLTVSKRKEITSAKIHSRENFSEARAVHLKSEMNFTEMPSSSSSSSSSCQEDMMKIDDSRRISNLKADLVGEESYMDIVESDENVIEKKNVVVKSMEESDAEIYRLIAQDLQPKSSDEDADVRQSISRAFLTAATQQEKTFAFD